MTASNTQRIFVKPDDTAIIQCPECHLAKTISVGEFRSSRHSIKVRCTCGHSYPVDLDFRRSYRKKTSLAGLYETHTKELDDKHWKKTRLTGVYTIQHPASGDGHMQVTNLSTGGLQFITSSKHTIEVGQQVRVSFTLDDRKQTEIIIIVTIQSVNGSVIGCQFVGNEPLEQALRFYLFP
ncbi:MAG: PilZ domain-containing [Desulfobulbaceae bacterium]|jgi:hypothetical protein|nr:MAG: PilZ domain-containing [Desulfobulbaceae bacterium]